MALSAPHSTSFHIQAARPVRSRAEGTEQLYLRASGDGWSLMNSNGEVLLRGFGLASRQQCLEYARAIGVLTVLA